MAFKLAAKLADLPLDSGYCAQIDGHEVGLYRLARTGDVHAMENSCPHAGYPLHIGALEGSVIICAGHGWPFDVCTGRMPVNPDGFPLERYPTRVEGDEVWVDLDNPLPDERRREHDAQRRER